MPSSIFHPLSSLKKWADFVKFPHTVFALPFALAGWSAARPARLARLADIRLILAAMVCARTCAMAFNRIVDRRFDAESAHRHAPFAHRPISLTAPGCFAGHPPPVWWPRAIFECRLLLSFPTGIIVICFYSLTKRFTDFTHIYLGLALAMAPLGAWLAVQGSLAFAPLVLALAVVFWLIGFDVIYALQDYEFDRSKGLHSLVVRWGVANALTFAFLCHVAMWGLLAVFGLISRFRVAYFVGLIIILATLVLEHWLARKRSLKWIQIAFFRLNALISLVFLIMTTVEVVFRGGFKFVR